LCDEEVGAAELRRAEFADAMIRALLVQPRPAFRVPAEIERTSSGGYCAVVRVAGQPYVFAAHAGAMVRGPADASTVASIRG